MALKKSLLKIRFFFILIILTIGLNLYSQPTETLYEGITIKEGLADDESYGPFDIGFNFPFFGVVQDKFYISTNGMVSFGSASLESANVSIPNSDSPNNFIAPFWDDLKVTTSGKILYKTIGTAPNRKLIIQFKNMGFVPFPSTFGTFLVILNENEASIQVQYRLVVDNTPGRGRGSSASIGLENSSGLTGVQHSYNNSTAISNEQAILFSPSGPTYTIESNAEYDGIFLTNNLTLPDPSIPQLISPSTDATIGTDHTFQWSESEYAANYSLLISENSDLSDGVSYDTGTNLSYNVTGLLIDKTYYWGVFASNASGFTWCQYKRFYTSVIPPLAAVPQTMWLEQSKDKTLQLNYSGGDASAKTAIITSLPAQGQLYQYNSGSKGILITSVPATITDPLRNVIYTAPAASGNGIGNFKYIIHDDTGDSPEATITVNVSPPGIPAVLYVAKNTGVEIQFDRIMSDPSGKQGQFAVTVNGSPATITSAALKTGDHYTISLSLSPGLVGTENVLVSYTPGDVTSTSGGYLLGFTDIPVTLKAQTINFAQSLDKKYSDSPFTLMALAPGGTLTYSSSNTSVATISSNKATFKALGSSDITARQDGDATYAPALYIKTLTVAKGDQTITFDPLADKVFGDADFTLSAVASSGLQVIYSSNNIAVATVSGNTVHIAGAGTAVISASQTGNTNYNAAPDVQQTLNVSVPTGMDNPLISQNSFKIYFSYGFINIQSLSDKWDGKKGTVRLADITGKTISLLPNEEFIKNSLIRINAPSNRGLYIVEVKSGTLRWVGKVMIR